MHDEPSRGQSASGRCGNALRVPGLLSHAGCCDCAAAAVAVPRSVAVVQACAAVLVYIYTYVYGV